MKKVISFSLWGAGLSFHVGAIENAKLAQHFFPDFECWFYVHKDSVHYDIINDLILMKNVKVILKTGDLTKIKPMMWRFESIDHPLVEINLSRDTDTRILLREKLAVEQWLLSDKLFHIMRDHPDHNFVILGGMFGTRKIPTIPSWQNVMQGIRQIGTRDYDQNFLKTFIYPIIKKNSFVHATFHKFELHAIDFPIPYDQEYKFVGEYVYFDESRSQPHTDHLINQIKK